MRRRVASRLPVVGPILVWGMRVRVLARHLGRTLRAGLRWLRHSREVSNFTYDLTPRNERQLAAFLAQVTGAPLERVEALLAELAGDEALRDHLRRATAASCNAHVADLEPRYGRRLGWYALVRLARPRLVVETGVDKGLGACLLAAALARNAAEGHRGRYLGIDCNPEAGFLLGGEYALHGSVAYGDSLECLRKLEGPVDLFIHDSDHSPDHEIREYEAVAAALGEEALVLSDNAHASDALYAFARRSGRRFLFFAEEPRGHWYPGAGIGVAFR